MGEPDLVSLHGAQVPLDWIDTIAVRIERDLLEAR